MTEIIVTDLDHLIERQGYSAYFGMPAKKLFTEGREPFNVNRLCAENCLGWIRFQWLKGTRAPEIRKTVSGFLKRSLSIYEKEKPGYGRESSDLYLFHCAVLADCAKEEELLARHIPAAKSSRGLEAFQQAWAGMLRFYRDEDFQNARKQAEIMWRSLKPTNIRLPPKPLVRAWLDQDWKTFSREQEKTFKTLSADLEGDGVVRRKRNGIVEIQLARQPLMHRWPWADNCLAKLALRHGARVATDPFWFPTNAQDGVS